MDADDNRHSRIVSWIKVIMILIALGLSSSLFIFSKTAEPRNSVTIPNVDLKRRAQEQSVLNPNFAGLTNRGYEIDLRATYAHPVNGDMQNFKALNVNAEIKTPSGHILYIDSDSVEVTQKTFNATFIGNVAINIYHGNFSVNERLETRFDAIFTKRPGPVAGTGPIGDIESDRMVLISDETTGEAHLLFEGDVKVTYNPRNIGE